MGIKEFDLFEVANVGDPSSHDRFKRLVDDLSKSAKKLVQEKGFDDYAVSIRTNKTKSEVNYPIEFNDIPYPFDETNGKDRMVTSTIATLAEKSERSKFAGCVEIRLRGDWWKHGIAFPLFAIRKETDLRGKTGENVYISLADNALKAFLVDLIRYRLDHYESSFPSFGCCHLYSECSDAGICLQKSRSYSSACQYRKNLDAGRVFYGKKSSEEAMA